MDLTRQDKPSILSFTIENIGGTITDGDNANIVMVGDRKEDIIGAKHHRFTSIGAAWGYADANELQDAEPDHIVSNADALRAILLPE
jgi:phosphoglycolate phosphatase